MEFNRIIEIKTNGSEEIGYLSYVESSKDIPFDIRRIYYTFNVPLGVKRGMHAHRKLQQLLWCPFGEIEVVLDDGNDKISYLLDSPEKGLLVLKGYWRDMYWKKDGSVLCVAASDYYDENDYIRDYDEFLKYVEKGYWNDKN